MKGHSYKEGKYHEGEVGNSIRAWKPHCMLQPCTRMHPLLIWRKD